MENITCHICGGSLNGIGESIDGREVFRCENCNTCFRKSIEITRGRPEHNQRSQQMGDVFGNKQSPEEFEGEFTQGSVLDDQYNLIGGPIRGALLEELVTHFTSGDIDYMFRDSPHISHYTCPTCQNLLPKGEVLSTEVYECDECNSIQDVIKIIRTSVLGFLLYRIGIQYRFQIEADARFGEINLFQLPSPPPEVVLQGFEFVRDAILAGGAYEVAKLGGRGIVGFLSAERTDQESENEEDSQTHNEFLDLQRAIYVQDVINVIHTEEFGGHLAEGLRGTFSQARLYSQSDISIDEYDKAIEDVYGRGTVDQAFSPDDDIHNEFYEKLGIDVGEMPTIRDEQMVEQPSESELDFFCRILVPSELFREQHRRKFEDLNRTEIVMDVMGDFISSFNASLADYQDLYSEELQTLQGKREE